MKYISVTSVVPRKANRSGSLMDVGKVYSKGSNTMGVGFSIARCDPQRAIAFQAMPGDDRGVQVFADFAK